MKTSVAYIGLAAEPLALTLNRAADSAAGDRFTLPADGWFQIGRTGRLQKELEMPGGKKVKIEQVVDAEDLAKVANRFDQWAKEPGFDGLLVDFDHFSADTSKSSRAAGWITKAEARGDQLWAQMRLSTSGRAALEGGDFRHFSPVLGFEPRDYKPGEIAHPAALLGGALTNNPTFRGMLPLSNRADAGADFPSQPTMKKELVLALLAALGMSVAADATPEAIDAALSSATEKAKGMGTEMAATKNRLSQLEGAEIERDLDGYKLTGSAREQWKGALTKNRADGLALLKATLGEPGQEAAAYARTHNRGTGAQPPAGARGAAAQDLDAKRDAEVRAYQTRNRCDFQAAWDAVRTEKPELFASTR